jgi:AraC-like DNA-binding protein
LDILADILRSQRLRGTVYFRADFREPWGLDIQGGTFANFHIVVKGKCWLRTDSGPVRALESGDVVLFPHGSPHALLHAPDGKAFPAAQVTSVAEDEPNQVFGGSGAVTTTLICGHFEFEPGVAHPLIDSLPSVVHVEASKHGRADWLAAAGQLAAIESASGRPGVTALVDSLAETLLVQTLLGYVERLSQPEEASFLAAIQDKSIGRVLGLIHKDPARDWTLDELALAGAMSRSVLTERFKTLVGASPMVYLAHWRMLKARELLRDTSLSIAQVAQAVGYETEFSFGKAFKRVIGKPPGQTRKNTH